MFLKKRRLRIYLKRRFRKASDEINDIKKLGYSKVGRIWEIRKKVMGGHKNNILPIAISHYETGKLIVSRAEIKQVSLNYCKATLADNEPSQDYASYIENKAINVRNQLLNCDGNFSITKETFDTVLSKFKRSRKRNYDYLVKAGNGFKNVVFKFCQEMISKEQFPKYFQDTTLHMVFKSGKGRRDILSNNRFIHSKPWWPRTTEALIVEEGLKGPLVEGSSIYQVGGQPGHRAEELVFVLKSIIAKQRFQGKSILIQPSDIKQYFDKEMIQDIILACEKRGADPKARRLWYKLNQDTRIQVRTGVGMSEYTDVGAVVGQGTIGGALGSQVVLDEGISGQFAPGGGDELNYGGVPMAPLMFQDDLLHYTEGVEEARIASRKFDIVLKQLNLRLHEDKTVCIVMGSTKQKQKIKTELQKQPLMCGSIDTKLKDKVKWLGQILSTNGLADSVAATVAAREDKILAACREIGQIISDWRAHLVGGMETALFLWESCCVPSLLNGAGTWTSISAATEKRLNAIQSTFLRLAFQTGPGSPLASMTWDSGVLNMSLRVWIEKIMLIFHIRSMDIKTLARRIYEEQKVQKWPGLAYETAAFCQILDIEDCNITQQSKTVYRQIVVKACHKQNELMLREKAQGKCDRINTETYGKKTYIGNNNIHQVRQLFRSRFGLQPFAGNYSKDKRFAKTQWLCKCGEEREEEPHLISGLCKVYGDLTHKFSDLTNDNQLAQFFKEVLDRRDQLEVEACGGGAYTTVGANPGTSDQDKPAQGSSPNGLNQL